MSEFDENPDVMLLRLTNNDRLIGQVIRVDNEIIALYAPMLIEIREVKTNHDYVDYVMSPYDPLSSTAMALISHDFIMTVTVPNRIVLTNYENSWKSFYPSLTDMKQQMLEKKKIEENYLDMDKVNEMFSSLLNGSVPINKKKLN